MLFPSVLFLSILFNSAWAKRLPPAEINPIKYQKGTISQSFNRSSKGFSVKIISIDKAGDIRWQTKILTGTYVEGMETDVQDIHLKSLEIDGAEIIAIDERGKSYRLDIVDGSLLKKK